MMDVSCAIIRNEELKILIVQRGEDTDHPLKWEFPGGKIKSGETTEDSIIREIDEELSMDIIITDQLGEVEYDYGFKQIRLYPLVCETLSDDPVLTEHISFRWIRDEELREIDLCEADVLIANKYLQWNRSDSQSDNSIPENTFEVSSGFMDHLKDMLMEKGGYFAVDIIAETIIDKPEVLQLMIQYSLSDDSRLAFRASYCLVKAEEKLPGIAESYYGTFARMLQDLENESVIRAFLKILNTYDYKNLDEAHHGYIADNCFRYLHAGKYAPAIIAYSMDALYKLCQIYPELTHELRSTILNIMEEGSAGVKARGQHVLKMLNTNSR